MLVTGFYCSHDFCTVRNYRSDAISFFCQLVLGVKIVILQNGFRFLNAVLRIKVPQLFLLISRHICVTSPNEYPLRNDALRTARLSAHLR